MILYGCPRTLSLLFLAREYALRLNMFEFPFLLRLVTRMAELTETTQR